jgi:DMSO/TMAO reductase YedYZ heme-binding membrane subunit
MDGKVEWYLARASGWVAFVLIAATVVWGVLGVTKLVERRGLPKWLLELHRYLALLSVVFTVIHLVALIADDYLVIGLTEIFVPHALDWRPGPVTWGIVAWYLLIVVQVSSWMRGRLPRRWWRGLHLLSYPMLWMVAMHGLLAGTDASTPLVRWGTIGVVAITTFFVFVRILGSGIRRERRRSPLPSNA